MNKKHFFCNTKQGRYLPVILMPKGIIMNQEFSTIKTELEKRDVLRMSNKESNRLTRECLQTALIALMGQKSFDKITISELVRKSGVSRTAFYRNYDTKEDILNEVSDLFTEVMVQSFQEKRFQNDRRGWYLAFFNVIKENASLFRLLLQAHMLNSALLSTYTMIGRLDVSDNPTEHYNFLAWEGALSTITLHWFQDGMKESVEFMADYCANNSILSKYDEKR